MGHHQPGHVVTNHDLAATIDTSDEWIRRRTGIAARHIARTESVTDLAAAAAGKALAAAGLAPADIGLVQVATCSAIDRCPSIAAQVAGRLGIPAAAAFDVNNACAGFCTIMATADHAIRAGAAKHALVIGAEKMSDITDWSDRSSCVLLGDGAGAAVLSADPDEHVGPVVWGSDPAMGNAVRILGDWHPMFAQDGQTVFRWATTALAPLARQACERAGVEPRELGAIVTHQANLRIIEAIVARLDVPDVLVATDVVESGNTSAASIPIALSKMLARNEIRPGSKALLFGFGGGLSWAGQVVTCY
jgi:3-oxoacyl-[acyl-carrier-protein] synthase-3